MSGDMNAWVGSGVGGIKLNDPRVNMNGERLMGFLTRMKMVHLNGREVCSGLFTRHCDAASTVLDYVCMEEEDVKMVKSVVIDEYGHFGGHSDHVYMISNIEIGGGFEPFEKEDAGLKSGDEPGADKELEKDFTVEEVKEVIKTLKNGKAKDVDLIPHEAIKNGSESLVEAVMDINSNI